MSLHPDDGIVRKRKGPRPGTYKHGDEARAKMSAAAKRRPPQVRPRTLDLECLREWLYIDGQGLLRWRKSPQGRVPQDSMAGREGIGGYQMIHFAGRDVSAHRVVFALINNRWPSPGMQVDHINGDKLDNRPENLREASRSQNKMNCGVNSKNRSGFRGVRRTASGKWLAVLCVNGANQHLGLHQSKEAAALAYRQAAIAAFGDFCHPSILRVECAPANRSARGVEVVLRRGGR